MQHNPVYSLPYAARDIVSQTTPSAEREEGSGHARTMLMWRRPANWLYFVYEIAVPSLICDSSTAGDALYWCHTRGTVTFHTRGGQTLLNFTN